MRRNENVIQTIDHQIERKLPRNIDQGLVVSMLPNGADVRMLGSNTTQFAEVAKGASVEVGDTVIMLRPQKTNRWIILGAYATMQAGRSPAGDPDQQFELAPPNNVRASDALPDNVLITWDTPPQQPVAFEVQYNTSASATGATSDLTTRGAYAILESSVTLYARVRSVSPTFQYSSWSDWVNSVPGTSSSSGVDWDTVLMWCNKPIMVDNEYVLIE